MPGVASDEVVGAGGRCAFQKAVVGVVVLDDGDGARGLDQFGGAQTNIKTFLSSAKLNTPAGRPRSMRAADHPFGCLVSYGEIAAGARRRFRGRSGHAEFVRTLAFGFLLYGLQGRRRGRDAPDVVAHAHDDDPRLPHTTVPEAPQELASRETTKSVTPNLKKPKAPELASLAWNGPERAPWNFSHLLLSELRPWRLCARCIFSQIVHSNAQRQNPDWCRTSRITSTKYNHFDKIGFRSANPRDPNPPLFIRGASGQKRKVWARALTLPDGKQPDQMKLRSCRSYHGEYEELLPGSGGVSGGHRDVAAFFRGIYFGWGMMRVMIYVSSIRE